MKRRTIWLGVTGGLLVAVAGLAMANPSRWVWLGDRGWPESLIGAVGLGMLGEICRQLAVASRGLARVGAAIAAAVLCPVALFCGAFGLLGLAIRDGDRDIRVVATSGDGRFVLLLHDTSNIIDPVQAWYVQTRNGPFSRRVYLGCFNPDSGGDVIESARFGGPDTVVLKGAEQRVLRFDPENVRSIDVVEAGYCAQKLYTG